MTSKSKFAAEHGAYCKNVNYAWSYINLSERFVLFGAWEHHTIGDEQLILSDDWEYRRGRRQAGYSSSKEHIGRILNDGFRLLTFPMVAIYPSTDGPAKVRSFDPTPSEKYLSIIGRDYFAIASKTTAERPISETQKYWEGARVEVLQTGYERNPDARRKCLQHYGFSCHVCDFNFREVFGDLGGEFIHVHHLKLISQPKVAHEVDPIKDLRPVCPNCHAMLHKRSPPLTIDELKEKCDLISRAGK